MKVIAVIPARYAATRFPAKLMQSLGGLPVIVQTYKACLATQCFDEVLVATDSKIIFEAITQHGGKAVMSKKIHESGSDRIAEAVADRDVDIIVNVQGDEPFVNKEAIANLLSVFTDDEGHQISLASLVQSIDDVTKIHDPNYVKVVVDKDNFALYFSRSAIPFIRDKNSPTRHPYFEHIGVYAFRKQALEFFSTCPMTALEELEKIECLRFLENGKKIKMVKTCYMGIEIDTPEDLVNANAYLQKNKLTF